MTYRENYLRAVEFNYPEWIPCAVPFSPLMWKIYREDLEKIVLAHPRIFPEYKTENRNFFDRMPPTYRKGEYFRDTWGCLWYNEQDGLEGQVVEHPLADWNNFEKYQPPDPLLKDDYGDRDWEKAKKEIEDRKKKGLLTGGGGGRLFDRLCFLRGFENLMIDIATDEPRLPKLIKILEDYAMRLIQQWLSIGVDLIGFHTDIGTQNALMLSPAKFRKYIKPMFKKLFQTCRNAGSHVAFSSDGRLLEIVDDLIECGISLHGPQLRANTLEGIVRVYKGKLCADVDLDRQAFPFMKPAEIRDQIKAVVDVMADPKGGFMVDAEINDGNISLKNIEAICEAMEEYCF